MEEFTSGIAVRYYVLARFRENGKAETNIEGCR